MRQKSLHPRRVGRELHLDLMPAGHRQKVAHPHGLELVGSSAGAYSGKNLSTGSSTLNFPSATASPTAVELKLLLNECITCGLSAASGFHQPSAITCPCRTSMKLCIVWICRSAASPYARMAAEETPCASGTLRGSGCAA